MNNSGDLQHGASAGLVRHGLVGTRAGYLLSVYFQRHCRQEGAAETTSRLLGTEAELGGCGDCGTRNKKKEGSERTLWRF